MEKRVKITSEKQALTAIKSFAKRQGCVVIGGAETGKITIAKHSKTIAGKFVSPREKNELPQGIPLQGFRFPAIKDGKEVILFIGFNGEKGLIDPLYVANKTNDGGKVEICGIRYFIELDSDREKYLTTTPSSPNQHC